MHKIEGGKREECGSELGVGTPEEAVSKKSESK